MHFKYFKNSLVVGIMIISTSMLLGCTNDSDNNQTPSEESSPDTKPDSFLFVNKSNIPTNTFINSNTVTISGINVPVDISITGGEYSIDGEPFTNVTGSIHNEQSIVIRLLTSDSFSSTTTATIIVGGIEASFSVSTTVEDITPDTFSFDVINNANLDSQIISNSIIVDGINTEIPVKIVGGEYAINDGEFTSTVGSISNGMTVKLRINSSAEYSTETIATITVGEVSVTYRVVTQANTNSFDINPDPFSFNDITDVSLSAEITSYPITITGINTAVPIFITGGFYAIDSGTFIDTPSQVNVGQTIIIKLFSSDEYSTTTNAILTVGNISDTFSVTTVSLEDLNAPKVWISYPPPNSILETDAGQLYVVGKATGANNITSVKINDIEATTIDGFNHWQATIPLLLGDNTINVEATDELLNTINHSSVVITNRGVALNVFRMIYVDEANKNIIGYDSKGPKSFPSLRLRRIVSTNTITG